MNDTDKILLAILAFKLWQKLPQDTQRNLISSGMEVIKEGIESVGKAQEVRRRVKHRKPHDHDHSD